VNREGVGELAAILVHSEDVRKARYLGGMRRAGRVDGAVLVRSRSRATGAWVAPSLPSGVALGWYEFREDGGWSREVGEAVDAARAPGYLGRAGIERLEVDFEGVGDLDLVVMSRTSWAAKVSDARVCGDRQAMMRSRSGRPLARLRSIEKATID
jgi:hypothetical protein